MRSVRLAAVAWCAMTVVGCSGGGTAEPSTAVTDTAVASTSTALDTTSVVADSAADTAPDTTVADGPVFPLTGLPVGSATAVAARPAMVVKIDNNAAARPQSGLNEADIVFEEIVEVQTRFAAVFHSKGADPVGPIRSGRTQDIDLLGSFNAPLFVWSGGNRNVTRAIDDSDLVSISHQHPSDAAVAGFFRSSDRESPHNLYAQTSKAWTLAPADAGPPPQQFQYLGEGESATGDAATVLQGEMDGLQVRWSWDSSADTYVRTTNGTVHEDVLSGPITAENLIVMTVTYRPSSADARSPEARTIGAGDAMILTGGVVVLGTWTRTDRLSPIVLTSESGGPVLLTPGRTWVELARDGTFATTNGS